MTALTAIIDAPDFYGYKADKDLWLPAVESLCKAHNIPYRDPDVFADGSNLVTAVGNNYIVKIYPPFHRHQWQSEYKTLQHINVCIPVNIPELLHFGEAGNNWTYIIITKIPGVSLEQVWASTGFNEKAALMKQIGELMRHMHSIPCDDLDLLPRWKDFVETQAGGCLARHTRNKMPTWFLHAVEAFVITNLSVLAESSKPVLLTGEYTPFNLLVNDCRESELIGMIDFGDSMIGFKEYDFLGPLMFLAAGNKHLASCLFEGYGYTHKVNASLRRRLFLMQILHRYSNFAEQVRIAGWSQKSSNMEELEQLIIPI